MTYWATLWYAGAVVIQLGFEGQTLNDCEMLTKKMISDIERSYDDPTTLSQLDTTMFPTNKFKATCETEQLVSDDRYVQ